MAADPQFSKARLETLCDGVFAIAMTLLVLDLKVPELPKSTAPAIIWHALGEHRLSFFAFFLTFMLTGASWIQHHVLFHYVARVTRSFALLNLVFLMFVSLVPFSTSLFAAYGSQQVGLAAYFGNQFVLASLMGAQWLLAQRAGLLHEGADPRRRTFVSMLVAFEVLWGLLLVVAIVSPSSAPVAMLPGMAVVLLIRRLSGKRAATAAS